jgi:Ca-activated chloride channel family protein
MDYLVRFAQLHFLYVLVPVILACAWLRLRLYKGVLYNYPLTSILRMRGHVSHHPHKKIIACARFVTLVLLAFLLAKPQLIDPRSTIKIEGIDIMVVLDVSGSMQAPHHTSDDRSRLEVAKEEAIRFIEKRTNDAIGLVIFGNDALSRCPLTADKLILRDMVKDLDIGIVNPDGTLLATAIISAANRLKVSSAKSKIMIVLTDGAPSENDVDPQKAIEVARRLGIKIYTVGIGDNQEIVVRHPAHGLVVMRTVLNKPLLTQIAQETGGKFFEAKQPDDMRRIYDTIDRLERAEIQTPLFSNGIDWFIPLVWFALIIVLVECVVTSWLWFSI